MRFHVNVQNLAVNPLACGSLFHLSFEHFVASFYDLYKSIDNRKLP